MIPFPNAIAGIAIGLVNDSWINRLLIPFVWGFVWCVYVSILETSKREIFITRHQDKPVKFGMSAFQAFYFVEYLTALQTSLIFSIIFGGFRELFS